MISITGNGETLRVEIDGDAQAMATEGLTAVCGMLRFMLEHDRDAAMMFTKALTEFTRKEVKKA